MANYRNISTLFWTDAKVDDEFTPEDKYFYLYLLTNPHTNICGCYEVGKKQMERETGYTWDVITRILYRMENQLGVIKYDSDNKEVLILNWRKYNWSKSAKVYEAVKKTAYHIKTEAFKETVLNMLNDHMQMYIQNTEEQNTEHRTQNTGTVSVTDGGIGDRYHINTVSDKPMKPKKNAFHNFEERRYDNGKLEDALVNK